MGYFRQTVVILTLLTMPVIIPGIASSQNNSKPKVVPEKKVAEVQKPEVPSIFNVVELEFAPEKADFVLAFANSDPRMLEASFNEVSQEGGHNKYLFGARVGDIDLSQISEISIIIHGSKGEIRQIGPDAWTEVADKMVAKPHATLKDSVFNETNNLKHLELIKTKQENELRRLQADIDLLSTSGKLRDIKREVERKEQELVAVKKDRASLKQMLTSVKNATSTSRSYEQREIQMSQDLELLNAAIKVAVNDQMNEQDVQSSISSEYDKNRNLAEIGKTANIPALKQEYEALKRRRISMED